MNNKVNGYGVILRFITPALITILLYMASMIKTDITELKIYFTNHLSNHRTIELMLEQRLTRLETMMERNNGGRYAQ